jgi:IS5 family transposase
MARPDRHARVPPRSRLARRWVVERSHAWLKRFGKLRWRIERRRACVAFWLALACVVAIIHRLVRQAWTQYRWDVRPHRRL